LTGIKSYGSNSLKAFNGFNALICLIESSYVRESIGLAIRNLQISFLNEPLDASFSLEPLNTTGFHSLHQVSASTYLRVAKLSESRITLDSFYAGGGYFAQLALPRH
jgi:hypothetical protein